MDAMRGFAILSVVFGHVLNSADPAQEAELGVGLGIYVVYLFNVQLFGFVSGFVTHKIDLVRKAKGLVLPAVSWVVVLSAVTGVQFWTNLTTQQAPGVFTGTSGGGMWFLWSLFVSFCIAAALRRWPIVLVTVAVLSGLLWEFVPGVTGVRTIGLILPYVLLGAAWRRYMGDRQVALPWALGSIVAFPLIVGLLLYVAKILIPTAGSLPLAYTFAILALGLKMVAAVLACVLFVWVSRGLAGVALKTMALLGTMSLGIFGFHAMLLMNVFPPYFAGAQDWVQIVVRFVGLVAVSAALTYLTNLVPVLRVALLGGQLPLPSPGRLASAWWPATADEVSG
jgi:fucose 4-O-acetylase-like acetyltransferase